MESTQHLNLNDRLTFEQRKLIFDKLFSTGSTLSNKLTDKFKLIYLVSLVTFKMKTKNKDITSKEVIEKIFKRNLDKPSEGLDDFLSTVAIISQDLLYAVDSVDILNYKNPTDIINDIKKLVSSWLPF